MSVIRVVHNKENPYVMLNKKALWDQNLSLKAVGLWARCMSRPDDWRFNVSELAENSKEGRKAIDSAIHELIKFDYAVRIEHYEKDPKGKFTDGNVEYVFFEFAASQEDKDKILQEFKKSFRYCRFGDCRDGDCRKGELLSTKEETKELKETKEQQPPTPLKGETVVADCKLNSSDQSELAYTLPNGSKASISVSLIFKAMVGAPYTSEEILEAIQKARSADYIREPIGYIKGILSCPQVTKPLTENEDKKKTTVFENEKGDFKWTINGPKSQGQNSTISGNDILAHLCQS